MSHRVVSGRQSHAFNADALERRLMFAPLLGTETASISNVVTGEQIRLLPTGGRDAQPLMTLIPGNCSADVVVRGNNLTQNRVGKIFEVEGSDFSIDSIAVSNGDAISSLTFKPAKGFNITLNQLTTAGVMNTINGPGVNFAGNLNLGGVRSFSLSSISDSVVQFGSGLPTSTFKVGLITGSQITFGSPVNIFQSGPILRSTTTGGSLPPITAITVPSVNLFTVKGDADLNLSIAGGLRYGLNSVNVTGALSGGTWNVGGGVDSLKAGSVSNAWQGSFGKYAWNVQIKDAFDGTLQTPSITTARFGSADGAQIFLSRPFAAGYFDLGSLAVSGPFSNSIIDSDGSIGRMDFNYVGNTSIFAGVMPGTAFNMLPANSQLQSNAQISSFNVRGGFANTYVAAYRLGSADFGAVLPTSGNTQFGATSNSIGSLRFLLDNRLVSGRNLFQNSEFSTALQRAHVSPSQLGNFAIRLSF